MAKKEILDKILEIFKMEFPDYNGEVNSEIDFKKIKDELNKKEFIMQVEEFFELKIAPRNLNKINTLNDLANHISRLI